MFCFSNKFWYNSNFSTQQKKLDFDRPSSDKLQFFRPNFGIFQLSRLNKKYLILFHPVQICFDFLDQNLIYFDFLDPTKNVRFCSTQFKYVSRFLPNIGIFRLSRPNKKCSILFHPVLICFDFLDQVLLLVYFDFLDSTKECSIFFDSVQICFAFSTKYWYIPTFSTQQKMFDFVPPSSDMFRLSRPKFDLF